MGCEISSDSDVNKSMGQQKEKSITLPASKLRFKPKQLQYMNRKMASMIENGVRNYCVSYREFTKPCGRDQIELLLRRLLLGAGLIDARFKSRYVIDLNTDGECLNQDGNLSLRYLVRLDSLSDSPGGVTVHYSGSTGGAPNGLAEVRLAAWAGPYWRDLTDENGYLIRRLLDRRLADLLALASSPEGPHCLQGSVNELDLMRIGSFGVADARVVGEILRSGSDLVIFPSGNSPVVPQVSDYHIAIVEDAEGVTLKLRPKTQGCSHSECHSSGSNESYGYYDTPCQYDSMLETTEVKLVLGLDVPEWPPGSDFPWRVSLHHEDAMIMYKAASTGSYLISSCEGRTSRCWSVAMPAATVLLRSREGEGSVFSAARKVLNALKEHLSIPPEALNEAILMKFENSEPSFSNRTLDAWRSSNLSRLVLSILDDLVKTSKTADGYIRDYFHEGLRWEISYEEGSIIEGFLRRLHTESYTALSKSKCKNTYDDFSDAHEEYDKIENEEKFSDALISKIEGVMKERFKGRRKSSMCFDTTLADSRNQRKEHKVLSRTEKPKKNIFSKTFRKKKSLELDGETWNAQGRRLELYGDGTFRRDTKMDSFKMATNFTSDPVLADYFTDLYEIIREAKCYMIKAPISNPDEGNVQLSSEAAMLYLGRRAGPAASGAAHIGEMQTFRTFLNAVVRGAKASQWITDGVEKGWCWSKGILDLIGSASQNSIDLVIIAGPHTIAETYTVRVSKKDVSRNRLAERRKRSKSLELRSHNNQKRKDRWSYLKSVEDQSNIDVKYGKSFMATLLRAEDRLYSKDALNLVNLLIALKKMSAVQECASILPEAERRSLLRVIGHASRHSLRAVSSLSSGLNTCGHAHLREIFRGNVYAD